MFGFIFYIKNFFLFRKIIILHTMKQYFNFKSDYTKGVLKYAKTLEGNNDYLKHCFKCNSSRVCLKHTWIPLFWVECPTCGLVVVGKYYDDIDLKEKFYKKTAYIQARDDAIRKWNSQ